MKSNLRLAAGLVALLLPAAFFLQRAGAHFPGVEPSAVCADGKVTVSALVVSWNTDDDARRYNDLVRVYFDGTPIGEGQFLASNGFAFTVTTTRVPDGKTYVVRAEAVHAFGPNQEYGFAGTSRQATLTLPENCVGETTTTAPTTTATTTTTRPAVATSAPTTAPPTTAAATTTTAVPTQVLGETVTRLPEAVVAQPVSVLPNFTG